MTTLFSRTYAPVRRAAVPASLVGLAGLAGSLLGPSSAPAAIATTSPAAVQQQTMGKFAYVVGDGRVQDFDIYVVNEDGTGLVDLSNSDGVDTGPDFSSDGRQIVFSSDRDADRSVPVLERQFEIYVMNTDGSNVRRLTHNPAVDGNPAWSPNGRMIAWGSCRQGGKCDVHVMNADGSGKTNLTNSDEHYDDAPRWSPDSRRIVFASDRDRDPNLPPLERGRDLYVMESDGSNVRRLTNSGIVTFSDWSPNGRHIAFRGGETGNEIWIMNANGTGQRKLRDAGSGPIWSPNGREIAFSWSKEGYVMEPDGSNVRKLTLASGESFSVHAWAAPRNR